MRQFCSLLLALAVLLLAGTARAALTWDFWPEQMNGWTVKHGYVNFRNGDGGGVGPATSTGVRSHDAPHETLIFESPIFHFDGTTLDGTNTMTVGSSGGAGDQDGDGLKFATEAAVLAYNGGNSNANGQKGLAFLNVDTNRYDAVLFNDGNGGINDDAISAVNLTSLGVDLSASYRLQFYENDDGGWGWGQLNYVNLAAALGTAADGTLDDRAPGAWHLPATWTPDGALTVPTDETAVIVDGFNVSVTTGNAVGGRLEITSPGRLTINSGRKLTLSRGLTSDGTISLQNGSQLHVGESVRITGGSVTASGTGQLSIGTTPSGGTAAVEVTVGGNLTVVSGTLPGDVKLAGGTVTLEDSLLPATTPVPGTPLGRWTFDLDGADDSSGNFYDGTVTGAGFSADVPPTLSGKSLDLTGGDHYVTVDTFGNQDVFDLDTFSVAAWVKGTPGTWNPYISKNGEEGGWQMRRHGGNQTLDFTTRGTEPGNGDMEGSGSIFDGEWHHVVMTVEWDGFNAFDKRIYIDGALDAQRTDTQLAGDFGIRDTSSPLLFGARLRVENNDNLGNYLNGKLDEILIYEDVLTPEQITAMAPIPLSPDMSTTDLTVTQDSTLRNNGASTAAFRDLTLAGGTLTTTGNSPISMTGGTTIAAGLPAGTVVGIDPVVPTDYGSVLDLGSQELVFKKAGSSSVTVADAYTPQSVALANATNTVIEVAGGRLAMSNAAAWAGSTRARISGGTLAIQGDLTAPAAPEGTLARWTMDDAADSFEAADAIGTYPASVQGAVDFVPGGGVLGGAADLGGANDHLLFTGVPGPPLPITNTSFTLAAWAKRDGSSNDYLIGMGDDGVGGGSLHWGFRDDNTFTFAFWGDDVNWDGPEVMDIDIWHHWASTFDADTRQQTIYVDGRLVNTRTAAGPFIGSGSDDFWIGRRRDGQSHDGMIDDVFVVGRALTGAEVIALQGARDLEMTTHSVEVDGVGRLEASRTTSLALGLLTMRDGSVLSTTAAPISFTGLDLAAGAKQVTLDAQTATTLNAVNAGAAAGATITKTGGSALTIMPSASTVLAATETVEAAAGDLIGYHDDTNNPFGAATLKPNGGNLVLSATPDVADGAVDYSASVEAAGGTITAGPAASGHAGPMVVNLAAAAGVSLSGDVTFNADPGYELNVGTVTGGGNATVAAGTVTFSGDNNVIGTLIGGGAAATLSGTGNVAAIVQASAGTLSTGDNGLTVSDTLVRTAANARFTIDNPAHSFSVSSPDLVAGINDLTLSQGTLSVGPLSGSMPVNAPSGVLAYWALDDAVGSTTAAELGGTYTGNLSSDPIWEPAGGRIGGAINLDGAADLVTVPGGLPLMNTSFSITLWAKRDIDGPDWIIGQGDSGGRDLALHIGFRNDHEFAFDFYNDGLGWNYDADPNKDSINSEYHHWTCTYDYNEADPASSVMTTYMDGVFKASRTRVGFVGTPPDDFWIGKRWNESQYKGLLDDVWVFDRALTAQEAADMAAVTSWTFGGSVADEKTNLTITGNATVTSAAESVELRDLTVAAGVTSVALDGAAYSFQNVSIADGATIAGEMTVRAALDVGNSGGNGGDTMTIDEGELVFDNVDFTARYNAKVSLGGSAASITADKIVVTGSAAIHLDGTLAPKGVGRTDAGFFSPSTTLTVVDNASGGVLTGAPGGDTPFEFAAVDPAPAADKSAHIGQGAFLRDVIYDRTNGFVTMAVDLDVFVALGGDTDGDKKVWLSDWAALRAHFGNTATDKIWTDGNFDPWVDGKVWLSDWAALRANFGNADYTIAEAGAAAVPEPGTIAMLLCGLVVLGWRRRRAG